LRLARRHVLRRETRGQAAQEEGAQAENGLEGTANCLLLAHKTNYTKKETFMQPPISQIL